MDKKQVSLKYGFRSGLEQTLSDQIASLGHPVNYETMKVQYEIHKVCSYTPDFVLVNGIIVESKGRFLTADRMKHRYIKEQHPELDIRFVFSNSKQRISKTSKTTYGKWCDQWGFKYADKLIPKSWFEEKPNE